MSHLSSRTFTVIMTSALPHTLDNLCKREKDKVVDMLKQLSDLKKRCAALEQELDGKQLENQRLAGREEVLSKQLETAQGKLLEAIGLSKESQAQIEQLTLRLQKSEAEKKALGSRTRESQAESSAMKERIREMRARHERIMVTASVQTRIVTCSVHCNTDDTSINLQSAGVQVPVESQGLQQQSFSQQQQSFSQQQSVSAVRSFATPSKYESTGESAMEADEELTQLISMLNQG